MRRPRLTLQGCQGKHLGPYPGPPEPGAWASHQTAEHPVPAGAPTCPLWKHLVLPNCPCSQESDPVTCPTQECCHSFIFLTPNLGLSDSPTGWNYTCRWRISPSSLPRPGLFFDILCSASALTSISSRSLLPSITRPRRWTHPSCILPKLCSAHTHWLQNRRNATNATFVTPKPMIEGRQKGGQCLGSWLSSGTPVYTTQIPPCRYLTLQGLQEDLLCGHK